MAAACAQQVLLVLHGVGRTACAMSEVVKIDSGIVGQRVGLEVSPEVFDRVEFGSVRRQVLEMRRAGQDALVEELALVGLEAVPDEHDGGAQLPLQMLEEVHAARGIDVGIRMQPKVQREPVAGGCDAQRSDSRHLLVASPALSQECHRSCKTSHLRSVKFPHPPGRPEGRACWTRRG